MVKLMGYQFEIHYRAGMENKAADGLSRICHTAALMGLIVPRVVQLEKVASEVDADEGLQKIIQELQTDPSSHPNFQLVDKHLIYKGRLYLPKGSALIPLILQEGHDGSMGGHLGFLKTYKRVAANVYWPGMKKDVHRYVNECSTC